LTAPCIPSLQDQKLGYGDSPRSAATHPWFIRLIQRSMCRQLSSSIDEGGGKRRSTSNKSRTKIAKPSAASWAVELAVGGEPIPRVPLMRRKGADFSLSRTVPPKGFEPIRRECGVPRGVLNIAMAKIGLQRSGVVAVVRQLVAGVRARM
jgi:hypothetical protein